MKLGLLADVHGNNIALEACLRVLDLEKVDELVFIGDAVGYLPMAEKVLKKLDESKATCLLGNHEAMLLGLLMLNKPRDKVYGLKMTRMELSDDRMEQISHWPLKKERNLNGRRLLFVHGSPWEELTEYIYPDSDLARFYTLGVDAVFMGHTHRPFINTVGKTLVVNVGSCGLPRDHGELSSCAVFDTDSGECRILRIPFDAQSVLRTVPRPVHPAVISSFARKEPQKPFGVLAE